MPSDQREKQPSAGARQKRITITLTMKQAGAFLDAASIGIGEMNERCEPRRRAREGAYRILERTIANVRGPNP